MNLISSIINSDVLEYLMRPPADKDPLIVEIEEFARDNHIPILESNSAQFLEILLQLIKPNKFLEIGTAIGYSTIRAAKILQNKAELSTIELSKDNIRLAKSFFERAGVVHLINLIEENALDYLKQTQMKYDFIFLDADKEDYPDYLDLTINHLLPGGILLVDNLLWKGYVSCKNVPDEYKKSTEFIRKFNAQFLNHPQLQSTILTIGDGLGLGIKIK